MPKIVMKFGGTSVADISRIMTVAKLIKDELSNGNQVIAVVSAMAGQTNELSKKQSVIQSQSRIIDTNYATETTALARSQIITRASINMHSIGSQAKELC